jgi:phage tail sheath protein FI
MTGIKAFEDTDNVFINVLCAPGVTSTDATTVGVHTQLRDTATVTNSIALIDIPANNPTTFPVSNVASVPLNIWSAIDWSNGAGQFISRGRFDTRYLACFFNWFHMEDPITQQTILAPPTIGALRTMAFTWLNDQPWYAAAGPNRGVINEATDVSWPKISFSAKEAATAPGNVVNLIIQTQGEILVYGEHTMQRAASKLTAIHNLVLVEFVVQGLAAIGRQRVFDPNDLTLLTQLNLAMTQFLDSVKNLRGIEAYQLVCDSSNNNATTRNLREVIVDLFIVPTDAVEKIYINATVLQSGAIVNAITG